MDTDSYRTKNTVKWCRCRHTETTTKERRYRHFSVFYRYSITVFRYLSSALYESLRTAYDNTYGLTANHNGQQLKTCRKKYRYRNKVFSGICHPYCKKAFIWHIKPPTAYSLQPTTANRPQYHSSQQDPASSITEWPTSTGILYTSRYYLVARTKMADKGIAAEEVQDSGRDCQEYRNNSETIPILTLAFGIVEYRRTPKQNTYRCSIFWNNGK